jgi:hypothetical protein
MKPSGGGGGGCIGPHFLDLDTRWRWVVSFTPRPLYHRERALGTHWIGGWVGPQSQSGQHGEEKILDHTGTQTLEPSVVQPIASHYTNYAIPSPLSKIHIYNLTQNYIYANFLGYMEYFFYTSIATHCYFHQDPWCYVKTTSIFLSFPYSVNSILLWIWKYQIYECEHFQNTWNCLIFQSVYEYDISKVCAKFDYSVVEFQITGFTGHLNHPCQRVK